MARFGGYLLEERRRRVQLPVLVDPQWVEVEELLFKFQGGRGVAAILIDPKPEVGPYDLTLYAECGSYLIMLSEYASDGDHEVRTPRNPSASGTMIMLGEAYPAAMVIRDFHLVRTCFFQFYSTGTVSSKLLT